MKQNQQIQILCICLLALTAMLRGEAAAQTVGKNIWSHQLPNGDTFNYKPLLQGNQWVVSLARDGLIDNRLMWFDRQTGQYKWFFTSDSIETAIPPSLQSFTVGPDNILYVMAGSGHLLAFDDTPSLLWQAQIAEVPPVTSMANGVPLVGVDGNIYVVSGHQKLVCVSPQGDVLWRLGFESGLSLFPRNAKFTTISQAQDGTLYLGSRESGATTAHRAALLAVNPNGTMKWTYRPGVTSVCPPTAFPGGVAFGTYEGTIHAVNHSGTEIWKKNFGNAIYSSPLYHNGRLWFTRYVFALPFAPPPAINDQSPKTVLITNTAGVTKGSSRRVSWGGLMTPEPLKGGSAFVSTKRLAGNGSILKSFSVGQTTPAVNADGKIYLFSGSYSRQSRLECVFAGVQPVEATRVIALPSRLSFGKIPTGTTSRKPMTIKNTGNTRMMVASIDFPEGFQGDWNGGVIASGGSQVVNVTFSPTQGRIYSGMVTVNSDKTSGIHTIPIKGTGIRPHLVVEQQAGSAASPGNVVNFGNCAQGFSSAPLTTFLLRNTGTSALTITDISLGGSDMDDFPITRPKLPLVVAPRRSARLSLVFRPLSLGSKSATLTIASNDEENPVFQLNLTGFGTDPDAQFPVGGPVNFSLPSGFTSLGQVLSITGLPRGLRFDPLTGNITGRPVVEGAFNARGLILGPDGRTTVHRMSILVEALPPWVIGSFTALIQPPVPSDSTPTGLGGLLKLTSSRSGATSGSLRLGGKRYAFRGQIEGQLAADRGGNPLSMTAIVITNTRDRTKDAVLSLQFQPEDYDLAPGLSGTMRFQGSDLPIQPGWRHFWNARTNPAFSNRNRTLNVAIANTDSDGPQGDGFARIRITRAGRATWLATLADGRKATGSFTLSPDGDVLIYAPIPYPGGGVFYGLLHTEAFGDFYKVSDIPEPNARLIKLPTTNPKATDRSYRDGFDVILKATGAEHRTPARGVLLFGNPVAGSPFSFSLGGAGINSVSQLGGGDPIDLAARLLAGNKIKVDNSPFPPRARFTPGFSARSGIFRGRVRPVDPNPMDGRPISRTLKYNGLYIPSLEDPASSAIRGFFLLPDLPDAEGETILNTPIQSGRLDLQR